MTPEDAMVLAVDAVRAIEIQAASDEGLALFASHLYDAARKVSKEQGDRMQARFNSAMEHSTYEVELEVIRGGRL